MAKVPLSNGRAILSHIPDGYQVEIPAEKKIFSIIFLCFWLVGWLAGELFAVIIVLNPKEDGLSFFLLAWLGGWTLGGIFAIRTVLWQLFGKEIIRIKASELQLVNSVWSFSRSREFDISLITDFRLSQQYDPDDWEDKNTSNGRIAFDYGKKTYRFASDIDEGEARYLIREIKKINKNL